MNKPATKSIIFFVITASIYFVVITVGLALSILHMMYWADSVEKHTNSFVSLGVLPFSLGTFLGCTGSVILEKNIFKNWKIIATGALTPLIPVIYVIGVMWFMNH